MKISFAVLSANPPVFPDANAIENKLLSRHEVKSALFMHPSLLAAMLLLTSCGSSHNGNSNTVMDRRMEELEYRRRINFLQGAPCTPMMGGMTPLWGVGIGSHTDGFQSFSNPGALYSIPQSR